MNQSTRAVWRPAVLAVALGVMGGAQAAPAAAPAGRGCELRETKGGDNAKAKGLLQELNKTNPCALVPGLSAKSLSTVWSAFLGTNTTGGKRFDTAPPQGTLTGKVLLAAEGLSFDTRAVQAEGLVSLQLLSRGASLGQMALNPGQPQVQLPARAFKAGESYDWVLVTRRGTYRGSFEMLDDEAQAEVQRQLAALDQAGLAPGLRQIYLAAIFDEAELYVDRDRVLAQLRQQAPTAP